MSQNRIQKSASFIALAAAVATTCIAAPRKSKADETKPQPTITMAVKYVALTNEQGKSPITQAGVDKVTAEMNKYWAQCNLQFVTDSYSQASAKDHGVEYNTSSMGELDKYRSQFDDSKSLLVVDTGSWVDMAPANAWTAMPGDGGPMGAIIEGSVADYSQIIAHELGHYMGLDHVSDKSNMMNPVIYDNSTQLTSEQCATARQISQTTLKAAMR